MNRDSFRVALLVIRVFCFAIMYVFRALRSICKMNIKAYINFLLLFLSFEFVPGMNVSIHVRILARFRDQKGRKTRK